MRKTLFLLVVLFTPTISLAQTEHGHPLPTRSQSPSSQQPEAKPQPKTNLRTRYDKFTGLTGWETKLVTVWKPGFAFQFVVDPYAELKMNAFAGKGEETALACGLYFYSQSKDWYYLRDSTLAILAGGNRYSFEGKQEGNVGGGLVFERIFVLIPCDTLSTILKSEPLEMRLGATEFKLKDKTLKELRMILPILNN